MFSFASECPNNNNCCFSGFFGCSNCYHAMSGKDIDFSCDFVCNRCSHCHMDFRNTKTYKCCLRGCSYCYKAYTMKRFLQLAKKDPRSRKLLDQQVETGLPGPKDRCGACNKKVGSLGFTCKCSGVFCGIHRYPEEHSCGFDYKTPGRLLIEKHNPVVVGDKLHNRV